MHTFQQASDTQLICLFQNGNDRAMETLVSRYKEKLFSSILFLVRDKYLAEDLFQEVFMRVVDTLRRNRYIEEGRFLPWIMRIAHNLCIDHFRKIKHSPFVKTTDDRDLFDIMNISESNADAQMMQNQLHTRVRNVLDSLPYDQREVIVLRHYGEFSFKEISQMTNCSVNTALGRMRYGLSNMRKMFPEKEISI